MDGHTVMGQRHVVATDHAASPKNVCACNQIDINYYSERDTRLVLSEWEFLLEKFLLEKLIPHMYSHSRRTTLFCPSLIYLNYYSGSIATVRKYFLTRS